MTQWGIDTLFNPAKRHMDEEKRRLQSTRQQIGDSSGGKRIDLESGKVTIQRAEDANDVPDEAALDQAVPDQAVPEQPTTLAKPVNGAPAKPVSAARKRAAARRASRR